MTNPRKPLTPPTQIPKPTKTHRSEFLTRPMPGLSITIHHDSKQKRFPRFNATLKHTKKLFPSTKSPFSSHSKSKTHKNPPLQIFQERAVSCELESREFTEQSTHEAVEDCVLWGMIAMPLLCGSEWRSPYLFSYY